MRDRLRRQCAVSLLVACVLGLDAVALLLGLLLPRPRLHPSLEFWLDDRSPSWLGALLWAPHHVGGFVFCMTAVLLLFLLSRETTWPRRIPLAVLAGLLFAAAVGTSTYIVGFFVLACLLLLAERLGHRDWPTASAFVVVGLAAILFSSHFLAQTLATQTAATQTAATQTAVIQTAATTPAAPSHALMFMPRDKMQAIYFYHYFTRPLAFVNAPWKATLGERLARIPIMLLLYVFEFGFFLFVIAFRARSDFRRKLPQNERWLWLVFASFAIPAFTLSTIPLQGVNDLGRHAGLCMRFILLLWATPLVESYLANRHTSLPRTTRQAFLLHAATLAFVLGLVAQFCQLVIDRTYIPLVDSGRIASMIPAYRFPHIARRFYDIRQAMQAAEDHTTPNQIVQTNPQGRLEVIFQLYASRQMAAVDTGCDVPFGGDPAQCVPVATSLVALFGGSGPRHQGDLYDKVRLSFDPAMVTPEAFNQVCRQQAITILVAAYTDSVWHARQSWVWQQTPIFANATARVFRCPSV